MLMSETEASQADEKVDVVTTVAASVLSKFFDELATDPDLVDISANLKKLVIDQGVFAEPAVKAVLFPDAP